MSLDKNSGWIWLDREFVRCEDAKIHVLTHSLHYGSGVFEGVRCYMTPKGPKIFRLRDHSLRLLRSAKILSLDVPHTLDEIEMAQLETIKRNNLHSAYIRPLIFSGAEAMGLHAQNLSIHLMVAAWPWNHYLNPEACFKGIRIKISSYSRYSANSSLSKAKATGNYLNSILAAREATRCGYDEALLLDQQGFVAEGSGENFFIIRNGILYTPDLGAILEGITRDTVFHIAKDLNIPVIERRITRDEVYVADEAFFTGTAAEILPIINIDDHELGHGSPGPITQAIQKNFYDIVQGKNEKYFSWLA